MYTFFHFVNAGDLKVILRAFAFCFPKLKRCRCKSSDCRKGIHPTGRVGWLTIFDAYDLMVAARLNAFIYTSARASVFSELVVGMRFFIGLLFGGQASVLLYVY